MYNIVFLSYGRIDMNMLSNSLVTLKISVPVMNIEKPKK